MERIIPFFVVGGKKELGMWRGSAIQFGMTILNAATLAILSFGLVAGGLIAFKLIGV